ncbi:MAG: CRISPR-associated endonuclease Cas2 [Acidimicrobiia bacterium]
MSARRRYIVAYDICDEARLRRVYGIVRSFGSRLQYSVFLCDLTDIEKLDLKTALRQAMLQSQDKVMFVDLGAPDRGGTYAFDFMGVTPVLPRDGPTIV